MQGFGYQRRAQRHAAIAVVLGAIAGCHHTPLSTTLVMGPKRELLAHAAIDERPVMLQLDTGASHTSVSPALCRRLGLYTSLARFEAPAQGRGAGGAFSRVLWTVARLRFAGEILHLHPMAVIELSNAGDAIDGVLGMDVLSRYVLDVDLRSRRFTLHGKDDATFRPDDLISLGYTSLPGGQIALAITIAGRPATAVLDLGANRTLANPHVALAPDDDDLIISAAIGADGHQQQFRAASDVRVALGELELSARSVWISDLPIFTTLGLADGPAVVLGTDVLADHRVVIDPFTRRVYVSR